jgi:two-component system response regulator DesR
MRVLLADDQAKVRSALRLVLELQPGLRVVGEAVNADDLMIEAETTRPDLVLLDWELPDLMTDGSLAALQKTCPNVCVVALSGRPEARPTALAAGADAFVSKAHPAEGLLAAIDDFRRSQQRRQVRFLRAEVQR